eukprot:CAMPEP_0168472602 /NCGR_PEP_ID=MMETSP0228-20121227/59885_1 /TAXON_ID=133427 /ORGANISM="Protoceratium reticulatum, Strain CCCM 535 (=CCMP 1889)" /LENGTH=236 /DNA_ID=CAMNT_0008488553 /DNA_START=58 /DNA_END=765 /DNA_ORIENTATION=-
MSDELFWDPIYHRHDSLQKWALELFLDTEMALRTQGDRVLWELAAQTFKLQVKFVNATRSFYFPELPLKPASVRGLDWKLDQGAFELWDWFMQLALRLDVKIVFLERRNVLRQTLSNIVMRDTASRSTTVEDAAKVYVEKRTVDVRKLLYIAKQIADRNTRMRANLAAAQRAGLRTMHLQYEDLVREGDAGFDAVRSFLLNGTNCSAPPGAVKRDLRGFSKLEKRGLRDMVRNFDE